MYVYASLSEEQVRALQSFEKARGVRVLALSDVPVKAAPIDDNALEELRRLERQLGVCLVAVQ